MSQLALQVFVFEGQQVRFVGTSDEPWWVASDVCRILGIENVSLAVNGRPDRPESGLDDDEKDIASVNTPGGIQEMLCINESGLYSLTLTSRKPQAKRFKKWITSEVLPSIRKTGKYEAQLQPQSQLEVLQGAINLLVEQERRMKQMEEQLANMERIRIEAEESIKQLPAPTIEAQPVSTRMQLNRLIRDFVQQTGCTYSEIWRLVYREFRDRYHIDLPTRAKNAKCKPLDLCEQIGMIDELYAVASVILTR